MDSGWVLRGLGLDWIGGLGFECGSCLLPRRRTPQTHLSIYPSIHTLPLSQVTAAASMTPAATGDAALTPTEARAVLVARVVSLVQGRAGVRREAVVCLAEALNQGM